MVNLPVLLVVVKGHLAYHILVLRHELTASPAISILIASWAMKHNPTRPATEWR